MADLPKIGFERFNVPEAGTVVIFADANLVLGAHSRTIDEAAGGIIAKAAKAARFTGKPAGVLDILAPAGVAASRLLVIGVGKADAMTELDWLKLGGVIAGKISSDAGPVHVFAETSAGPAAPERVADLAQGIKLGAYQFDRYKTKKKDDNGDVNPPRVTVLVDAAAPAKKAFGRADAIADGVLLARDLVNLPPNDQSPQDFAKACEKLGELGVIVEILNEKDMKKLGMGALLGVGQGSARESRVAIMRWEGAKGDPVAFVGKGVVFDTGGISIKPAQGMEDMKGDMAGAACVTGLMHALAARKAKVHAVGLVGLVENMPDGNAQRPGDIVRSMSGQTIEIINTDAEGRLVLADVLWYAQDRFKPRFMVDLATLTGAILVALGQEHAGLFSNDDELADRLLASGKLTGEKLWRMPLSSEYDKIIDSKFADVKNSGGRHAGAVTAAQFLQRFVNDRPWAHLDIAGTGMAVTASDINRSWGPGFGVRLLDRLVAEHYEG